MSGVRWSGYRSSLSSTEVHLESCSSNSSESQICKQKSIEILVLSDDSQFTLSTLNEGELEHTPGPDRSLKHFKFSHATKRGTPDMDQRPCEYIILMIQTQSFFLHYFHVVLDSSASRSAQISEVCHLFLYHDKFCLNTKLL